MYYYDEENYDELSHEFPNIIKGGKVQVLRYLPHLTHAVVEIFLTNNQHVVVEAQQSPIRFGRHFGSRVILSTDYGKIDYNPKFIWNGKEWLLHTYGTFVFAELELNTEDKKCTQ